MSGSDCVKHTLPIKLNDEKRHLFPTSANMVYRKDGKTPLENSEGLIDADTFGGKKPSAYALADHVHENTGGDTPAIPATITWEDVENKPETFPPANHDHNAEDVGARPSDWMPTVNDICPIKRDERWDNVSGFHIRAYEGADTTEYKLPTPYVVVYVMAEKPGRGIAIAVDWREDGKKQMWINHLHDDTNNFQWGEWLAYMKAGDTAADSSKLGGKAASEYAAAGHTHSASEAGIVYSSSQPDAVAGRVWLKPIE